MSYFNIYAISHTPSNIYVEIYRSTLQDIYFSFFVYNLIHCTGWCRDDDDDDDVFGVRFVVLVGVVIGGVDETTSEL